MESLFSVVQVNCSLHVGTHAYLVILNNIFEVRNKQVLEKAIVPWIMYLFYMLLLNSKILFINRFMVPLLIIILSRFRKRLFLFCPGKNFM